MEILSIILFALSLLFLGVLIVMNTRNTTENFGNDTSEQDQSNQEESQIGIQIRAVLDPMTKGSDDLCSLFQTVRANMLKNMKTDTSLSDAEAKQKVEQELAVKIPGGALPCPILTYPRSGATDLEWLSFLQNLPSDFGARIVFMALYARETLKSTEQGLKDALSGKSSFTESFAAICPPDVADTRRAEAAKKGKLADQCILPEEADATTIQSQVTTLLQTLVAEKTNRLKSKDIDPLINIEPLLQEAKQSQLYLEKQSKNAESGTLELTIPS